MNIKQELLNDNVILPEQFFDDVDIYIDTLLSWNKIHNMTGATTPNEVKEFIYDALYPISFLPKLKTVLDIGTGAGFPGLILAMALKDTHFTLVEPLRKRASFLQFMKATLKLKNVDVINKKVEFITPQIFDMVTSRAVTDTNMLMDLSAPHVEKGSLLLFFKGENVYNEVDESLDYKIIKHKKRHYLLIEN